MNRQEADKKGQLAKAVIEFEGIWHNDHPRWALLYVEAERPVPLAWRDSFYDHLVSPDLEYRKQLEESLHWFGINWV